MPGTWEIACCNTLASWCSQAKSSVTSVVGPPCPGSAGTAALKWTFALLTLDGSATVAQGSIAGMSGAGTATSPYTATLPAAGAAGSGGLFRVKLTATRAVPTVPTAVDGTPGIADTAVSDASGQFALGKPPAPQINSASGGEKVIGLVVAPQQTVFVGDTTTRAIQPTTFVVALK